MDIIFYEKENKKVPVKEFIISIEDKKLKAKTLSAIKTLALNGQELREPYTKYLRDGIFELRVKQSNNITRILYFFCVGDKAVLTNGFIKKGNKTPASEIEKAVKYRKDYLKRGGKNEV